MKANSKKIWAGIVLALLFIIAVAVVDIALMLRDGISVEYVITE